MPSRDIKIKAIPATPAAPKLLRVAAYARVSAEKETAFHSLEAQTEYYEQYIAAHPDWNLVNIYSDNAISGTKADRPEFQRMLNDCNAGKIDLIITKSITRFARNTVVLLESVRELKRLGVNVYFEKEDMHSISPDGELLLTLLAMYAEEEARSASENQKWRIKKRFEQGQPWTGKMLGYRLVNGQLTVIPEEAKLVQHIFKTFLSGKSAASVAKELNRTAIPAIYSYAWGTSTIIKILKNEKYTGSMLLQKTYCPDFRIKKQVKNRGEVPMYEVMNSHEAIISLEDFNLVQEKLENNRKTASSQPQSPNIPYLFSGLVKCGQCGGAYRRKNNRVGEYKHPVWTCRRFDELGKDTCPAQAIREDILIAKTKEMLGVNNSTELTRELLQKCLVQIIVPAPHQLVYHFKNGAKKEATWQHKSRRESWTPEMREQARQKALEQHRKSTNKKSTEEVI